MPLPPVYPLDDIALGIESNTDENGTCVAVVAMVAGPFEPATHS